MDEIDAEVERILAMSDDEILAEVRAAREDPEQIASQMRALFERIVSTVRSRLERMEARALTAENERDHAWQLVAYAEGRANAAEEAARSFEA